jgi:hypothetical protein
VSNTEIETPGWAEIIREYVRQALSEVSVAIPGQVQSYDKTKQRADVQPLVKFNHVSAAGEILERLPVCTNVRVMPVRLGQYFMHVPCNAGDTGLLIFCDRSIDKWKTQGGEQDPGFAHIHALSDAVFIPGAYAEPDALPTASLDDNAITLGKIGQPLKEAARKGDPVVGGTISLVHVPASGAGVTPCSLSVSYTPGDGSAPQGGTVTVGTTLTVHEKITGGSSAVKVSD